MVKAEDNKMKNHAGMEDCGNAADRLEKSTLELGREKSQKLFFPEGGDWGEKAQSELLGVSRSDRGGIKGAKMDWQKLLNDAGKIQKITKPRGEGRPGEAWYTKPISKRGPPI